MADFKVQIIITFLLYGATSTIFIVAEANLSNSVEADLDFQGGNFTHNSNSTNGVGVADTDTYENSDDNNVQEATRNDTDSIDKYVSTPTDIILEHVDFVSLRLRHILNQTTTNITELREIQEEEFSTNEVYREGWERAKEIYNASLRQILRNVYPNGSIVHKVPEEYHIALIGYSMQYPYPKALFTDFNEHTRELCSGKDIMEYKYKSYFKLLELAVEALGQDLKLNYEGIPPKKTTRFLYRGVSRSFALKEGQLLAFQHFISTSIKQIVAEGFSGGGTVFEFDREKTTTSSLGAYLGAHSVFAGEEEVLLSPLQIFQVDSIHEGYHYTRYVLKSRPIKLNDDCGGCDRDVNVNGSGGGGGGSRGQEETIHTLANLVTVLASALGVVVVISITGCLIVLVLNRRRMSMSNSWFREKTVSELQLT